MDDSVFIIFTPNKDFKKSSRYSNISIPIHLWETPSLLQLRPTKFTPE